MHQPPINKITKAYPKEHQPLVDIFFVFSPGTGSSTSKARAGPESCAPDRGAGSGGHGEIGPSAGENPEEELGSKIGMKPPIR